MEAVVIVLGVVCAVLAGAVIYMFWRRPAEPKDTAAAMMLKSDMTQMSESINQLKDSLQKQISDQLGTSNKQMASQHIQSIKTLQEVTKQLTEIERTNKSVGD